MKNLNSFKGETGKTSQAVDRIYMTIVHNVLLHLEERGAKVLD